MSVLALYRGNTAPGQLIDSSPAGNNLTLFGTVPNSLSPTPPEGDGWLAYKPLDIGSNFLKAPSSVYNNAQGMVGLFLTKEIDTVINTMIVDIRNTSTNNGIGIFVGFPGQMLTVVGFTGGFGDYALFAPIVNSMTPLKVRLEWRPAGVKLFLNDIMFGSSAIAPSAVGADVHIAGDPITTSSSYEIGGIDFVQFSNDPDEEFPAVPPGSITAGGFYLI